jgi:hypothetical protein
MLNHQPFLVHPSIMACAEQGPRSLDLFKVAATGAEDYWQIRRERKGGVCLGGKTPADGVKSQERCKDGCQK